MKIIVTDEKDSRYVEFCQSFNCEIDIPQVVLLLLNDVKTIGCASFRVYDADSIEIMTLFVDLNRDFEKISYDLVKQLEKIAMDLDFKTSYVFLDEDDLIFRIFKKLDYQFIDDDKMGMKKDFRSLV